MNAIALLILQSTPWDAVGVVAGGGTASALGFLWLFKRMIERQETATKENTKATQDLTIAFIKHQAGVTRDIAILNESVITLRRETQTGFKAVEERMKRGAEVHKEFKQRMDKQSTSLRELTKKIDQRNGS